MKIGLIGSGYVRLVSGACFADLGYEVVIIDTDRSRIDNAGLREPVGLQPDKTGLAAFAGKGAGGACEPETGAQVVVKHRRSW